jgi:hypothetical protein
MAASEWMNIWQLIIELTQISIVYY